MLPGGAASHRTSLRLLIPRTAMLLRCSMRIVTGLSTAPRSRAALWV